MNRLMKAGAMAIILFLYGFVLSNFVLYGEGHTAHESSTHFQEIEKEAEEHGEKGFVEEILEPLHPKIIHFPIVLFITALGLELISFVFSKEGFHQSALSLFVFGALFTPLVVQTGMWEAHEYNLQHPVLDHHKTYALWTMWLTLMSLPVLYYLKEKSPKVCRTLFAVVLIGTVVLVTYAGHYGGTLVYEYGVGTKLF